MRHVLTALTFWILSIPAFADDFEGTWDGVGDRTWAGPDYWANRLQDWRVADGRLECLRDDADAPNRTVHLLSSRIEAARGPFEMSVTIGRIGDGPIAGDAASGFLLGVGQVGPDVAEEAGRLLADDGRMDYRAAATIHRNPGPGGGVFLGIEGDGRLVARSFGLPIESQAIDIPGGVDGPFVLTIRDDGSGGGLTLSVTRTNGEAIEGATLTLPAFDLSGGVALVSHPGTGPDRGRSWFDDWTLSGDGVIEDPERRFGPIVSNLYTVQRGVLKLTCQLMPVKLDDRPSAALEIRSGDGWRRIAEAEVEPLSFVAAFRVEGWDASEAVSYRVVFGDGAEGDPESMAWEGTIRDDPIERDEIVLAALSCCEQFGASATGQGGFPWATRTWFPHADLTVVLPKHEPDLYFFAGDQIYEGRPTPPVRSPLDEATLDYLYKWYLWCWSFGDLVRDTPCVCLTDDHDMFQGNIWGMAGAPSREGDRSGLKGGYGMPPEWVNAVQRTQTSHLPDPFDPTPALQGIGVYYTALEVGGIGFAILEDRKFKSSPAMIPAPMTPDSHIVDPSYDIRDADLPGSTLLGDRQLEFLRHFAGDWTNQEMKAALSQTIFCNLQISSRGETAGLLDRDLDSNAWPQSGRARALDALRTASVIHIAGDQHLASVLQHGNDAWEDSAWSFCVPAISNLYPRFWNPDYPPFDAPDGLAPHLGRYLDGFSNKLTIHAVANPIVEDDRLASLPEPRALYAEGVGYGIVRFRKSDRTITLECWPRHVDPADPATGGQYEGWPIVVRQEDNDGDFAAASLPTIEAVGVAKPLVEVLDDETGALITAIRARGPSYMPTAPASGRYTIRVSEPETGRAVLFEGVATLPPGRPSVLHAEFPDAGR